MDGVEHLYKCFGVLADAQEKAGDYPNEYQSILNSVNGTNGEKKLAASFIPRFFKYFPDEHLNALNCLLDLCEDEDTAIRRLAIKALPSLGHDNKEHLTKIADVLTQLLQTGDTLEFNIVQNALRNLIKQEPKASVVGVFSQILSGDEETREHAINFLRNSVIRMIPDTFHPDPEAETALAEEIQKAMTDVTGEEFKVFVEMLSKLKVLSDEHQQLVDLITEQAELDHELQSSDSDHVEKFVACCRLAIQFFEKGAEATRYFRYIIETVFPIIDEFVITEETGDLKLEVFKVLAEICTHTISDDVLRAAVEPVFEKLLEYMPLPPVNEEKSTDGQSEEEPQLQFSYIECLMYTFHQLGRKHLDFLTADDAVEKLRDFKLRLQFVGQGCQMYIKQLKMALSETTGAALKEEASKVKVIALRTTSNIHTLIKDLFHSPPSYSNHVTLSWVVKNASNNSTYKKILPDAKVDPTLDEKRKRAGITPITFESKSPGRNTTSEKKQRTDIYLPPGRRTGAGNGAIEGKTMPAGSNRRGRGRGRGFRGRRGNRGNTRGWRW